MLKKTILAALLLLCLSRAFCQTYKKGWSLGVNPLSLAESQLSLGPCAGYRFNERLGLWSEASFIFANSYMPEEWKSMKGLRFILQGRYYLAGRKKFFLAPEFRIKSFSFNNRLTFVNDHSFDTLSNFSFREKQVLAGGALVIGRQIRISRNGKLFLETTFGIGGKQRFITRKNVPEGYKADLRRGVDGGLSPNYEYELNGTVYFPASCRIMWNL